MAMGWIKIEACTPDKPEIFAMAERLGMSPEAVLGGLVRFWIWADQQTVDGHAICVTKVGLDRISCTPGLWDAMVSCGWLVLNGDSVEIPNFTRHNGDSAKKRSENARRKEKSRTSSQDCHVNSVTDVTQMSQKQCDKSVTREEKRREEKNIKKKVKKKGFSERRLYDGIPDDLCTDRFLSAWIMWVKHRAEKKVALTDNAIALQMQKLSDLGEEKAIAAIEFSVMNNYQGIFEASRGSIAKEAMPWD